MHERCLTQHVQCRPQGSRSGVYEESAETNHTSQGEDPKKVENEYAFFFFVLYAKALL